MEGVVSCSAIPRAVSAVEVLPVLVRGSATDPCYAATMGIMPFDGRLLVVLVDQRRTRRSPVVVVANLL